MYTCILSVACPICSLVWKWTIFPPDVFVGRFLEYTAFCSHRCFGNLTKVWFRPDEMWMWPQRMYYSYHVYSCLLLPVSLSFAFVEAWHSGTPSPWSGWRLLLPSCEQDRLVLALRLVVPTPVWREIHNRVPAPVNSYRHSLTEGSRPRYWSGSNDFLKLFPAARCGKTVLASPGYVCKARRLAGLLAKAIGFGAFCTQWHE